MFKNSEKGVTFIEVMFAIGLLAVLSGAAVYLIDPVRQFAAARNNQRVAHVNTILNAVHQRIADNRGTWNSTCGASVIALPSSTTTIGSDPPNLDLGTCLVPVYLSALSMDPSVGTATNTAYTIFKNTATGRITISASSTELGETILITR